MYRFYAGFCLCFVLEVGCNCSIIFYMQYYAVDMKIMYVIGIVMSFFVLGFAAISKLPLVGKKLSFDFVSQDDL